jgi:thiol-disulfide isomerase/thioredoxin
LHCIVLQGDLDGQDDYVEPNLTENADQRLRIVKPRDYPQSEIQQQAPQEQQQDQQQPVESPQPTQQALPFNSKVEKNKKDDDESGSEDDSDFDDDDDDPVLEAFRQRRLAQLKKAQIKLAENKARGHGEVRTISQDEFLPECTGSSEFIAVHFFHKEFERCKLMDHHLKKIAPLHLSCKFVRIDAENTPFFVAKLNIKTLPTLIMFRDGKAIDRLTGFEGLSDRKNPDEFPTSRLGRWLESTKAIEYQGPDSDEEDENITGRSGNGMLHSRFQAYDEDI